MQYYMVINGERRGPYDASELVRNGLHRDTLVWREGLTLWIAADALGELQDVLVAAPPSAPQPAPPQAGFVHPAAYAPGGYQQPGYPPPGYYAPPTDSRKLAAGICAILIGWLGIHKFILGYNTAGITMLLVSILSCGVGAVVMHIIAIIEGITYLTRSDAQFYNDYVVNRKEWF